MDEEIQSAEYNPGHNGIISGHLRPVNDEFQYRFFKIKS